MNCTPFIRPVAMRARHALSAFPMSSLIQTAILPTGRRRRGDSRIRLGFVPLTDSAPMIVAREFGFFQRRGCDVVLSRELGWASIRDKLAHGELDGAHAPCGLPFALRLGLGCLPTPCTVPLVLSLNGNAITLGATLSKEGVTDAASLAAFVRRNRHGRKLVFGVVAQHSTHTWFLQTWLRQAGIDPQDDVRIVVVPPPQLSVNLQAGNLDGFCVGEPWNTVAIDQGIGWCAATSCEFLPGHPEKVLAIRTDSALAESDRQRQLTAALIEACEFCTRPENGESILNLLSRREYLGLPVRVLRPAWTGRFKLGPGEIRDLPGFVTFHKGDSNEPTAERAAWVAQHLIEPDARVQLTPVELGRVFRHDLYVAARDLLHFRSAASIPHELCSDSCVLSA